MRRLCKNLVVNFFLLTTITNVSSKLAITSESNIDCDLQVRPANGFLSIADDRMTVSVIITCNTVKMTAATVVPPFSTASLLNHSFLLISEELSIHAFPEDSSIVHFQPKYGAESLLMPPIFGNLTTTAVPVINSRFPGVHVIKFRPGISYSLQWCAFPRLLGRTNIIFTVKRFQAQDNATIFGDTIIERLYLVKVCRNFRAKDLVFRGAMALAATISAAGLGCGVDIFSVADILCKRHRTVRGAQGLVATVIQAVIRVMIIPGMSLGLGLVLGLPHASIAGLLLWSTTCGGGISYILSSAVEANEELAIFLELMSAIMGMIFTPIWMYIGSLAMLDVFDDDADATAGVIWLYVWAVALNVPVVIGIIVREYYPLLAHIYISWILRPSMLLFFILFITLGIYSNLTVISEITAVDIIALGVVITVGMLISLIVSRFLGWPDTVTKALLSQQCSSNILLSLALCRLALRSPERDTFTKITFLAVFYSPMPFFLIKVCIVTKNQISNLYSRQHQQQVSGLADVVKTTLAAKSEQSIDSSRSKQDIGETANYFMKVNEDFSTAEEDRRQPPSDHVSAL